MTPEALSAITAGVSMLSTPAAVLAVVNYLKREWRLPGKYALLVAVFLGVAVNLSQYFFSRFGWYAPTVAGILLGLAASGVYDMTVKPESKADDGHPSALDPTPFEPDITPTGATAVPESLSKEN